MNDTSKSLAWLLFGACVSVLARLFFLPPLQNWSWYLLTVLTFICFLWALGILSKLKEIFILWRRKGNRLFPARVGIINLLKGDENIGDVAAWTDIYPAEWKKEIEKWAVENKIKVKVDLIDVGKRFDSYAAVLNPYGGSYPEKDIKNFQTLNDIFDYVNKGGIFVNIADIPGYWLYSISLKRKLDATEPIYSTRNAPDGKIYYDIHRLFARVPFMERLGLITDNTDEDENYTKWNDVSLRKEFHAIGMNIADIQVNRVIQVERNVEAIIEPKQGKTPFFRLVYGDGIFIISLIFIGRTCPQNYKIKEIIIRVMIEMLKKDRKVK